MLKAEMYDIIKRPLVTEKTAMLGEQNKYVFEVHPNATKPLVKKVVEGIFGVLVTKVNMLIIKGKRKRFKGTMGKKSDVKKAIVTLAKDNVIDLTGGVK
jgi:large subunit ribosomal protein L23